LGGTGHGRLLRGAEDHALNNVAVENDLGELLPILGDIMPSEPPEQRAHYNIRPVTGQRSPRRRRSVPAKILTAPYPNGGRTQGADLRRTFRVLRRRRVRQNGRVRIAIGSIQSIRRRLKLEPLQQRFVLRMVCKAVWHDHREGRVGESDTAQYIPPCECLRQRCVLLRQTQLDG
jgi:hypothetical protein